MTTPHPDEAPRNPVAAPAPAPRPEARHRSLLPREHGAWGQLAMPLVSALVLGGPAPAALLLAVATGLAFLAHEPWLVLLGHRGARAQAVDGSRARRAMRLALTAAVLTGLAGLWLAPAVARLALLLPTSLATAVGALVLARRERTVPGELTVVSAFASSGLAVALAGGAPLRAAAASTVTWLLAFAASVFAVQVVLVRARSAGEAEHGLRNAALVAAVAGGGSLLALAAGLGLAVPAGVAPTALLSLGVCLIPFSARRLRTLGWGLVGSTTVSLVVLLLMLQRG
jgi:hypothetical protein